MSIAKSVAGLFSEVGVGEVVMAVLYRYCSFFRVNENNDRLMNSFVLNAPNDQILKIQKEKKT